MVAGACGEIAADLGKYGKRLINPVVAVQNFEYKMSNILDKPLESVFGYISVLPGAFSAYRYSALQGKPLESYFKGEGEHGTNVKEANMYLAEDRILCFELVVKEDAPWVLKYVKSAKAETDVPNTLSDLIKQRRRWLNGSFFAALHATLNWMRIFRSAHTTGRKWLLFCEFIYNTINLIFSWFSIANFYLTFYFLFSLAKEQSECDSRLLADTSQPRNPGDPFWPAGPLVFDILRAIYLTCLAVMFVAALGNRPEASKILYYSISVVFALIMGVIVFMGAWTIKVSIENYIQTTDGTSNIRSFFNYVVSTPAFRDLVISTFATYGVYLISSLMHLDPWHAFTCFVQYLFMTPSFINILMVYACEYISFCISDANISTLTKPIITAPLFFFRTCNSLQFACKFL
jgi:chitin synthase